MERKVIITPPVVGAPGLRVSRLTATHHYVQDRYELVLHGVIDEHTVDEVEAMVWRLPDLHGQTLVIDAHQLLCIDSVGLLVLVVLGVQLHRDGVRVELRCSSEMAHLVFDLTGLLDDLE